MRKKLRNNGAHGSVLHQEGGGRSHKLEEETKLFLNRLDFGSPNAALEEEIFGAVIEPFHKLPLQP